nr:immunoglobulin heavy chain junction region [Mus musculus]MBK4195053.1 immunoglobulin heavy chain junction region [Mus musculus]
CARGGWDGFDYW